MSIFDWRQLKDVVQVTIKKRQEGLRSVILLLILLMLTIVAIARYIAKEHCPKLTPLPSDSGITYLYTRKKFHWGEQEYTQFSSTVSIPSKPPSQSKLPLIVMLLELKCFQIRCLIRAGQGVFSTGNSGGCSATFCRFFGSVNLRTVYPPSHQPLSSPVSTTTPWTPSLGPCSWSRPAF